MSSLDNQNYDTFSGDYDRFVNWQNRLSFELPFLLNQIDSVTPSHDHPLRILDAACGTGMHAIALAQKGYRLSGSDISAGMITHAQANAQEAGVDIRFETVGFGNLASTFGPHTHNCLLCLGNSLPHLLNREERISALRDFGDCLSQDGLLLLQNRNFDAVMVNRERSMDPVSHFDQNKEWIFLRFYEYTPNGLIGFNIVTLFREDRNPWKQSTTTTFLLPLLQEELLADLSTAGFNRIECYGGLDGSAFHSTTSGNLVVTARKA
jgi:glycine/sarcosine N-methyltransferase